MWSSLSFYQTPDVEVTSWVWLSTKAVYFVLDDTIKKRNHIPLSKRFIFVPIIMAVMKKKKNKVFTLLYLWWKNDSFFLSPNRFLQPKQCQIRAKFIPLLLLHSNKVQ